MFPIFSSRVPSDIIWWHKLIHFLCPLGIRSSMLPLETLSTALALVKSTWPELWSQSSPKDLKSFRFLKGNKNTIIPTPSLHTPSLKISSYFTIYFKSFISAFLVLGSGHISLLLFVVDIAIFNQCNWYYSAINIFILCTPSSQGKLQYELLAGSFPLITLKFSHFAYRLNGHLFQFFVSKFKYLQYHNLEKVKSLLRYIRAYSNTCK